MNIYVQTLLKIWLDGIEMNCRFCKNYVPVGTNGGYCNLLTVPVQGKWAACSYYLAYFSEAKIPAIAPDRNLKIYSNKSKPK